MSALPAPATAQVAFDHYEVVLGSTSRQTVLTGHLLGGGYADLAVVHIDEVGDRQLQIFRWRNTENPTWTPALDVTLPPEVSFVDVGTIGGFDRLLTYEPGSVNWIHPESGTARTLVAVTSSFAPPRGDEVPHVDVTRDVNGDDRDDLVVPDFDGFWVIVQMSDGRFADPVKIGPTTDLAGISGADGYRYDPWTQSRVYQIDYDQDGRRDLVFWNDVHFEVHRQDELGLFAPLSERFTTDVAFDSDNVFSLATGEMTGRVLHSVADLNGDGIGDLVVVSLEGQSISTKRSAYQVHLGRPRPEGGTSFAPEPDIEFSSDNRVQLAMDQYDFDGDGQLDLMFTTIDVTYLEGSFWKRLKGLMGDDIWLDLEFYCMAGGVYPDEPNATRRVQLDGPPSPREPGWVPLDIVLRGGMHERRRTQEGYRRLFNTILLTGDVTGDDRADLLIGWPVDSLHILVGVARPELFAPRHELRVTIPNDHEYTWLADLNGDDRQDVLLHRPSATEAHHVTLLIAK